MIYKLAGLEPSRVFYYFEEITRIPHGSFHTKPLSDYCKAQAENMGLSCVQDQLNNLIVKKPASPGYEDAPAVMLQGHLDMVTEKVGTSSHDFTKDPLDLFVEDGWIGAKDTTLGADDGIAIAMMLAILEDRNLSHPALECVFTTEEEIGMEGAWGIDLSQCESRYLVNLDSEDESFLLASCAGGLRADLFLPVGRTEVKGILYTLGISGLLGGHSGEEIDRERANASVLMGRLLFALAKKLPVSILELAGGTKDNAITRECRAVIAVPGKNRESLLQEVRYMETVLRNEYRVQDPGITVTITEGKEESVQAIRPEDQEKMLFLLTQAPYGVQYRSMEIPGLVETSLNLGIMELNPDQFSVRYSVRSSVESRGQLITEKLETLITFLGGEFHAEGKYPGWQYQKESRLRDLICQIYENNTGKEMVVRSIHAGLECGILLKKRPGMDAVSIGPDMKDIHTPSERLNIASTERIYRLLTEVLAAVDSHF